MLPARGHPRFITNPYALATAELAALGEPAAGASPAGAAILARAAGPAAGPLRSARGAAGPARRPGRTASAGRSARPVRAQTQHGPRDDGGVPRRRPLDPLLHRGAAGARVPVLPVEEEPWQLHATTRQPFGRMAAEVFEDDPAATGVLAVIGDLADPDAAPPW